jgi:hypothetical protein
VATEEQANKARNKHADALVKGGAHAVGIDKKGAGFVVVAHVAPNEKHDVPDTLSYRAGKKMIEVPVVKKLTERFEPE